MGYIYLYTGTGGGKTTNALGLALRSVGHNRKVVIIQFLKWRRNTGEYKIRKRLQPYYEIYQFGRMGWKGLKKLGAKDKQLTRKGWEFTERVVKQKKPHLLVLDEINLALYCKLLDVDEVIAFLEKIPKRTDVVLTGRHASRRLIEYVDFVNEIVDVKHPRKHVLTRGVQY